MIEDNTSHQPINFLDTPKDPLPAPKLPRNKRWRYLFLLIVIFLIIKLLPNNIWASFGTSTPVDYDSVTLKPKKIGFLTTVKNYIFRSDSVLAGENDDRVNILLLGIGGAGHDGPYLSDTNIILSIRPKSQQIALVSIPRDLGVNLGEYGVRKINAADAYGETKQPGQGGEYARTIFAKTFDMEIPYYVRVDFKAFADLIDSVGGISIDVPRAFSDELFPGPNNSYAPISFAAGLQTMNGETALKYARSRHGNNGEGSDFARARRQQQVISALKQKLLSFGTYTNPATIQQILNTLSTHVVTNLNFGQIMYLASLAREMNGDIKTLVLDNSPDGFLNSHIASDTGAFLLIPKTGNFDHINYAVKHIFDTDNPLMTEKTTNIAAPAANKPIFASAKIEIQNGTWYVGLAARHKADLETKGFTIFGTSNSVRRPIAKTGIYLINQAAPNEIVKALSEAIGAPIHTNLPDWLLEGFDDPATSSTEQGLKFKPESDILVILGEDAVR